ncbi:hypothetical protein VSU19_14720 [Verrucomicrobiales bacterium BCK34]|nr:hypothetical protein [Verrucomicrobiales bacterium BCK34]
MSTQFKNPLTTGSGTGTHSVEMLMRFESDPSQYITRCDATTPSQKEQEKNRNAELAEFPHHELDRLNTGKLQKNSEFREPTFDVTLFLFLN